MPMPQEVLMRGPRGLPLSGPPRPSSGTPAYGPTVPRTSAGQRSQRATLHMLLRLENGTLGHLGWPALTQRAWPRRTENCPGCAIWVLEAGVLDARVASLGCACLEPSAGYHVSLPRVRGSISYPGQEKPLPVGARTAPRKR